MLRLSPLILLAITRCYCMEMHETVERMVMVRTTGSDLQPEATGFIYKKENDGKEKVVEMGESEVMEHLSKIYEQPKAFAAPIPIAAGPFYSSEDGANAPSNKEERVIPVKENNDEVDGIADEDYGNIFKEYAGKYNGLHSFDDYLHGLGNYDHGLYRKYGYNDNDNDRLKEYKINHQYGKGGAGNYHSEKFETYKVQSGNKEEKQDNSDTHGEKDDDPNKEHQNNGEERNGFHKFYTDKKGFYNDDSVKNGFQKYASDEHESDNGHEKGDLHEKRDDGEDATRSNEYTKESDEYEKADNSDEEESPHDGHGQFGAKIRGYSKSYGFAIEH